MTFLAPLWLLLVLLALPLLLLHGRRQRRLDVASVRLWKMIEHVTPRRPQFRLPPPSLLLFLQLAIIVFTALALAQPRLSDGQVRAEHTIFMLDASGSMRASDAGASRFVAAVDELRRRIEVLADEEGGRVSLIVAGAEPSLLLARRQADSLGGFEYDRLMAGDGSADWDEAFGWIGSLGQAGEASRVVLLTDGGGGAPELIAGGRTDLPVEPVVFGEPDTANAGLVARVLPSEREAGKWLVSGEVVLFRDAPAPDAVSVRFSPSGVGGDLDWGRIEVAAAEVEPDPVTGLERLPFSSVLEFPGSGLLHLFIADDAGPSDNAARFVLRGEAAPLSILFVGNVEADVLRALMAIEGVEVARAEGLPANAAEYDLVVAQDVTLARHPGTNLLLVGRARLADEPEPAELVGAYLTEWRGDHPLSRNIDWSSLGTPRFYPAEPLPGAAIIAEAGGAPLVQARTLAEGREVRVAIDPDLSRWAREPSFPAFVAGVVDWLGISRDAGVASGCVAGVPCRLEARELAGQVTGPDGRVVYDGRGLTEVLAFGVREAFVPSMAGFHTVAHDAGSRVIAVNSVAAGETAISAPAGSIGPTSGSFGPLWWWLAAVVLVLLAAEAWIAGRGAERFLVPSALSAARPHFLRRRGLLVLRVAAMGAVAAALLLLPLPMREAERGVVAVLGAGDASLQGAAFVEEAVAHGAGLVTAGSRPGVALDIGQARDGEAVDAFDTDASGVNLEASLALALAMLPDDRPGHVLVAMDGQDTAGEMVAALGEAKRRSASIDVLPLGAPAPGEVLVERVVVPRSAHIGDRFPLNAFIHANGDTAATVTVLQDGVPVTEQQVALGAGYNRVEAVIEAEAAGTSLIEVIVAAAGDKVAANNRDGAMVEVVDPASILIITPGLQWGNHFSDALDVQGLSAKVVHPRNAPPRLEGWLEHDLAVLMNMPALDLSFDQQLLLTQAVRQHGLGLLILGGEDAFGPGGYYQTPLEELSPLSSRVPHEAPVASLVFVVDRSGSMQARVGDVTRLDIAKAATLNAIELLHEESRIGIVAFDSESYVILPLLENRDLDAAAAALDPVQPGGGTALLPGLTDAVNALIGVEAEVKHIIVMTDGLIEPVDFSELMGRAEEAGITVSTIAIGTTAITDRLAVIARAGGGTYHKTKDFRALPSILAQETVTLADSPVKEETTPVVWVNRTAPFLANLPAQMPEVESYVTTTLKPEATLHLGLVNRDTELVPLMASWRQGNGRVLAFATHGAGSGAQRWMDLSSYPLFWGQIARHFLPNTLGPGLHLAVARRGDRVLFEASLLDERGTPVSGRPVSVVLDDEAPAMQLGLVETAPGRYVGEGELPGSGTFRFEARSGDQTASAVLHAGYPARLDFSRTDFAPLTAMAAATDGRVLGSVGEWVTAGSQWGLMPQWRHWLVLALGLFICDLIVRQGASLMALLRRRPAGSTAETGRNDQPAPRTLRRA